MSDWLSPNPTDITIPLSAIRRMKINRYYILPIFTIGLLLTTLIINEFRFELFGIRPGYAPHNFGFNMFFFLPSTLICLICALYVVLRKPNNEIRNSKFYSIVMVSPILILWIWQIIRFTIAMNY